MTVAEYFERHRKKMGDYEYCELICAGGKGDACLDREGDAYLLTIYREIDDDAREQSFPGDADIELAVAAFVDSICSSAADREQMIQKWKRENGLVEGSEGSERKTKAEI